VRTYLYGGLLAQEQGLNVDLELLCIGSVLHDIGTTPQFISQPAHRCFATTGAREAAGFVLEHGWSQAQRRRKYETISVHFNTRTDHRVPGTEALVRRNPLNRFDPSPGARV
jgi:HD superfamily phosphodiesterase